MDVPERGYLTCAMSGAKDYNRPLMGELAAHLRSLGYEIVNPAELDDYDDEDMEWIDYLKRDIGIVGSQRFDFLALVTESNWRESFGVRLELLVAMRKEIPIRDARTMKTLQISADFRIVPEGESDVEPEGLPASFFSTPEHLTQLGDD